MYSKELLKGTLKPILLKLLSENGKMYGYEIVQAVKTLSDDKIVIKEGSLYPLLHTLNKEGILEAEPVMIGKRVRKYYTLTKKGKRATADSVSELSDFLSTIEQIISNKLQIMLLNIEQLQIIQQYVADSGLDILEVQEDVIDHLSCLIEDKMEQGVDFENAFTDAQQYFSTNDLKAIQEDTIYYLTIKKRIIMIKTIFISAYLSVIFYIVGVFIGQYGSAFLGYTSAYVAFAFVAMSMTTFCFVFLPALFLFGYRRFINIIKA